MTMSAETVVELGEVFAKHGWPTHRPMEAVEPDASLFDRFCHMLEQLNADQQGLILELCQDFLKCPLPVYSTLLSEALEQLTPLDLGNSSDVIFVPLTNPLDAGNAKSGSCVTYLAKPQAPHHGLLKSRNCFFYEDINRLEREHSARAGATIVFLDDYLGTGETAVAALDDFDKRLRKQDDCVIVVVLVSLQTGFIAVQSRPTQIVTAHLRTKGISDSKTIADKKTAIRIMLSIEEMLSVPDQCSLGYQRSEGLESMIRTPDNTFPVFWLSETANQTDWPAPFPR